MIWVEERMGDMKYVAGVDIGNATTEVALAKIDGTDLTFLASGIGPTTGIKGTLQNISGVFMSLKNALEKVGMDYSDLAEIRINEAAPVIGDVAMETISETVITESTVIGHNPSTPGGTGIGVGTSVLVTELSKIKEAKDVIVIVPDKVGFAQAATLMNQAKENINITGAIVQADDGVLLNNRLDKKIPIIDEVAMIEKVPLGMTCAIEVAQQGSILSTLSNPYGIATVFHLNSEETKRVVPIARSLIGARSGVVIKTPTGDVKERSIKAGTINIIGLKKEVDVDVDEGADKIMEAMQKEVLRERGYDVNRLLDGKKMVLITGHRRENFGDGFIRISKAIKELTQKYSDIDFIYPMHLNPNVRKPIHEVFGDDLSNLNNMFFIEPLEYLSFVYLMEKSTLVLTDSGGVQEEAPGLGKPVLVMRDTTERPEAVSAGTVRLVGTDCDKIISAVSDLLCDNEKYESMSRTVNPYGDGVASHRIVKILLEYLK